MSTCQWYDSESKAAWPLKCGARILDPDPEGPCAECGRARWMSIHWLSCVSPEHHPGLVHHTYVPPLPVCEAGHVQPREEART